MIRSSINRPSYSLLFSLGTGDGDGLASFHHHAFKNSITTFLFRTPPLYTLQILEPFSHHQNPIPSRDSRVVAIRIFLSDPDSGPMSYSSIPPSCYLLINITSTLYPPRSTFHFSLNPASNRVCVCIMYTLLLSCVRNDRASTI